MTNFFVLHNYDNRYIYMVVYPIYIWWSISPEKTKKFTIVR